MQPAELNLTLYRGTTFARKIVVKDADEDPVNITGWTALALVRVAPQKHIVLDLAPVITNASAGEITISFTDEETLNLSPGEFFWDFVLERPSGEKLGPFLAGTFVITTANTRD